MRIVRLMCYTAVTPSMQRNEEGDIVELHYVDSCRVYQGGWPCEHSSTCVGVRALQCHHEWSRPDHLELKANKDYSYFYKKKKTHRLQCLLLSFKVKCTLSTTNQPWKHGVLVHRRSFLISLQLSQQSSLHRLLSAPSSSVRYDPGAATGRLVDRRHRFSLPGHVHIHFRQTVGQVTIAVHLGEPGEPRTTRLYWMWWTGPLHLWAPLMQQNLDNCLFGPCAETALHLRQHINIFIFM